MKNSLYVLAALAAGAAAYHLSRPETVAAVEKGLAFDFGQSEQNVDQSVTYNISEGASPWPDFLANNKSLIYIGLGVVGLIFFVIAARKKK